VYNKEVIRMPRKRRLKCPECGHALIEICPPPDYPSPITHWCPYCKSSWLIVCEGIEEEVEEELICSWEKLKN